MAETALGGSGGAGNAGTGVDGGTSGSGAAGSANSAGGGAPGSTAGVGNTSTLGGQGTPTSWREQLPEDIRNNPAISSFQDIGALTKSFIHAQSQIGKKGVFVPGDKATPEEWSNFYQQLGVPAADKYDIKAPDGTKVSDEFMGQYKEVAAKTGLLPKQAQELLAWNVARETATQKAAATREENETKVQLDGLKKEWGDGYDKEIKTAELAVKELGSPELVKYLNESGVGNNVNLIKLMSKVGKLLGEDKLREGGVGDGRSTPSEITNQLNEIRAQGDSNGFFDKNHPMHSVTMAKFESLAKQLTGGR